MTPFSHIPPESKLYQSPHFFIIRDRYPVSPGHLLIISHHPRPTFFDLTEPERNELPALILRARQLIEREYQPTGYNIGMNCGTDAGQTVLHFHCHVIPRYAGDMEDPRGGVRHCVPGKGYYRSVAPL